MKINNQHIADGIKDTKQLLNDARTLSEKEDYKRAFDLTLRAIAAQQEIIKHFWAVLGNPD
jgi:hypothetical protein